MVLLFLFEEVYCLRDVYQSREQYFWWHRGKTKVWSSITGPVSRKRFANTAFTNAEELGRNWGVPEGFCMLIHGSQAQCLLWLVKYVKINKRGIDLMLHIAACLLWIWWKRPPVQSCRPTVSHFVYTVKKDLTHSYSETGEIDVLGLCNSLNQSEWENRINMAC